MDVGCCFFLEPSTLCCCMDFYLALKSREYSHINVGWFQVGERMIVCLLLCCFEELEENKILWEKERNENKKEETSFEKRNRKSSNNCANKYWCFGVNLGM